MKKLFLTLLLCFSVITTVVAVSPEEASSSGRPTVAVVLSGGVTRSFGHIVLLETLEEMGIPIDAVYGSSSGAIVGGLYCAGYSPKEIREIVDEIDILNDIIDLNSTIYRAPRTAIDYDYQNFLSVDITDDGVLSINGISKIDRLAEKLNELLSGIPDTIDFDELPVRFRCTTTLTHNSELSIIEKGSLVQTICTASSLPLLFVPVYKDGEIMSDGGFSDNVPADLARADGYDIVITENMNYTIKPDTDDFRSVTGFISSLVRTIVDRETLNAEADSDVFLTPDYKDYSGMNLKIDDGIYEIAEKEINSKRSELEAIAALFEDGAYVKDPDRVGDYQKLYAKDTGKYEYVPYDWSRKLEDYSTVSAGITAFSTLTFSLSGSNTEKTFKRNPGINVRFYSTKLGDSPVGLDLNAGWNNGFTFDAEVPVEIVENVFAVPQVSIGIDDTFSFNNAGAEIRYSDREKFSFEAGAFYSPESWYLSSEGIYTDVLDTTNVSKPRYSIEYTLYSNPEDFTEYDVSGLAYLKFFGKQNFSISADICARKYSGLTISNLTFGGKLMPEFDYLCDYSATSGAFISAGLGSKYVFKEGIVDLFAELNVRGGFVSTDPLIGASIAFGIDSPFGDIRLGVEADNTKKLTLFFDFR